MDQQRDFSDVIYKYARSIKRLRLGLALGMVLALAGSSSALPINQVDQQNLNADIALGVNLNSGYGQSFTPTLPAIDAFEFFTTPFETPTVVNWQINLRQGAIDGLILGTSLPVNGPITAGNPVIFMFPSRIVLTPGNLYVAEILFNTLPGVPNPLHFDSSGSYAGGSVINANGGIGDYKFREGLSTPVPEPSTLSLFGLSLGLGIAGLVVRRRQKVA